MCEQPDHSLREQLEIELKQLKASRDEVENATYVLLLMGSLLAGCFVFVALMNSPLGSFLAELQASRVGVALLLMLSLPAGTSIMILSTVPRRLHGAKAQQARLIRHRLEQGSLAVVVMDEALWEPVYALMRGEPWLHWTGQQRPQSLPQQIEQAADYWRTALLLESGEQARLPAAVRSGSRGRRIDNIVSLGLSRWMLIVWLVFAQMFIVLLLPLLLPALFAYHRQRAAHIALLEFFIEQAEAGKA